MIVGYAVATFKDGRPSLYGKMGVTKEEGQAYLIVARIEYPNTYKDGELVEIHSIPAEA